MKSELSTVECAQEFGVSVPAVACWIRAGCPYQSVYHGKKKHHVYNRDDVSLWLNSQRKKQENHET